jgi:tRNA-splicing ligase RtcB (3'-phosphate/5'-hydroxy nucleic acid ligase)
MKRKILSGKDVMKLGYPEGRASGIAINTVLKYFRRSEKEEIYAMLTAVLAQPKEYIDDAIWSKVALELIPQEKKSMVYSLEGKRIDYRIFGGAEIDEGARNQMEIAMKLPITVAGALMPDAHMGYGLPIGGVLAASNAVIPYGVGVDIGCRMSLSAFAIGEQYFERHRSNLKQVLIENTCFGRETFKRPKQHEVLDRKLFDEITLLKPLRGKAAMQIGSSGSGNHFVEFGLLEVGEDNEWQIAAGRYLTALSHSGSRALGAEIARHYTKVAKQLCMLPSQASALAWLTLDSSAGQEYWQAMNLAGDYASANHEIIHHRIASALGEQPMFVVENHHNFAWKETLEDGKEVIVHRKGATPAGHGVLGIIPGSMATPGFIVKGKGNASALNSASHGAGRTMSRSAAKQSITNKMLKQALAKSNVDLIGGGIDEAPMAYKDITKVMGYQKELVEILGVFTPKIVRMCGDDSPAED